MLKSRSKLFAAVLLAALASCVVEPNPALAAAPQHHDQVPGFYRMKLGDLEVTALFDGAAVFDLHWLTAKKATMDRVEKALHQDPHLLDAGDTGFAVNTQSAQAIAAPYIKAGKWHTFSDSDAIGDGLRVVSLHGHTPGHTGYEFSSQGQKILFWGDTIHEQLVQLSHSDLTVVFDIDHAAAAATRNHLLPTLAREAVMIAGPHMPFPGMGRLRKEANGYVWAPVIFTDQWAER
jgi:glyoxylase-like metal-dependent hydrolase (beta-lactamase superfamily II)